jgi:hypothetical protein
MWRFPFRRASLGVMTLGGARRFSLSGTLPLEECFRSGSNQLGQDRPDAAIGELFGGPPALQHHVLPRGQVALPQACMTPANMRRLIGVRGMAKVVLSRCAEGGPGLRERGLGSRPWGPHVELRDQALRCDQAVALLDPVGQDAERRHRLGTERQGDPSRLAQAVAGRDRAGDA